MENKKCIWIINGYAGAPKYGGGMYRHFYLAKEFNKLGYKTIIISGSYSHIFTSFPDMNGHIFKKETIDSIEFLWIKVIRYSGSFSKKRVIKWFEFVFKLFFIGRHIDKPDFIISSPTEPFPIIPAYYFSKKYKAKLICEVRDIWPLSLMEIGGFSSNNPMIKIMSYLEKFAIKKSDTIVSNLENYSEHIKELGFKKNVHWISNGINLQDMMFQKNLPNKICNLIPKDKFIIGYTGKIGISNAIILLLEAAKALQHNKNLFFVIVGNGSEKNKLKKEFESLKNVIFINAIPKNQIQSMLKLFDVCYIGWMDRKLYKYGISANKIFDYMYSGKCILQYINQKRTMISKYNCGIDIGFNNEDLAKAIEKISKFSKIELQNMGDNGKKYVLEYFTYEKLAQKYISILESL